MPIDTFAREARAYCAFVDGCGGLPVAERLDTARRRLLALYTAALALPVDAPSGDSDPPHESIARPATWQGFGAASDYWEGYVGSLAYQSSCGDITRQARHAVSRHW